jgi:uncharacterized protein (TIGR02421 family)
MFPLVDPVLTKALQLDARLVEAAKSVKVLSSLAWPDAEATRFLSGWRKGKAKLPDPATPKVKLGDAIKEFEAIAAQADADDPLHRFLQRTARSYAIAARMLGRAGTKEFTDLSTELYGRPTDPIGPQGVTSLDAAHHFVKATEELGHAQLGDEGESLTPEQVQTELQRTMNEFFREHPVKVVLEPGLSATAAASADRIRLRADTTFTAMDLPQLIQHEGLVHTLTLKNGRHQPRVKSLGLGAPRTTATQEGLATLAELITGSIDLARLRRLALRVLAIHCALHGADFVDVFRLFLDAGQSEQESFHSAQRVFRGGDPKGGIAFTKDVVYLQGLIAAHSFLRKAIQEERPTLIHALFAGRLTLGDAVSLENYFRDGVIAPPLYEPPWVKNRHCLAANLAFSIFTSQIELDRIALEDFGAREAG